MATQDNQLVLIAGAGIASLLLARFLKHSSIPFIIFERDSKISSRGQGYRLRLSAEGLDAIESVLNLQENGFASFWEKCGKTGGAKGFSEMNALTAEELRDATNIGGFAVTQSARALLPSRDGKMVDISREDMRAIFLNGCEDSVKWGREVSGYETIPNGVRALFADGSRSIEGAMLVGGDGISSKVAKQVSQGKLKTFDTGALCIHGEAPSSAFTGLSEGVWRLVDESNPGRRVFAITSVRSNGVGSPSVKLEWTMGSFPGVIVKKELAMVGEPAAKIAKSLTANWHPTLRPIFAEMDEDTAASWKITSSDPSGVPEWPNEPRVTVIGDAAHPMTPAGGFGANTALRDSELLGRLLTSGWRDGVTAEYERAMRKYASEAVKISYEMARPQYGITIDVERTPVLK